jgi:hypothetical protein
MLLKNFCGDGGLFSAMTVCFGENSFSGMILVFQLRMFVIFTICRAMAVGEMNGNW